MAKRNETVVNYWLKHYVSDNHLCSLCGNFGAIDTRAALSPAGVPCGRMNWCICPNGQAMRLKLGGYPEQKDF